MACTQQIRTKIRNAQFIERVRHVTPEIEAMAGRSMSDVGSGGMATKIMAAEDRCLGRLSHVHLGRSPPASGPAHRRRRAVHLVRRHGQPESGAKAVDLPATLRPAGALTIDDGALKALRAGKSLLPAGSNPPTGGSNAGTPVSVLAADGSEVARGIVAYSDADAGRIMGRKSSEIEALLGFSGRAEMIHRDDLVILHGPESEAAETLEAAP